MEKYTQAACWLAASINAFVDLTVVLDTGMKTDHKSAADVEIHMYVVL